MQTETSGSDAVAVPPSRLDDEMSLAELIELYDDLRRLDTACGAKASKHDRAIVLITACIDRGIDTRAQIVDVMRRLGFNYKHVAILLEEGSGNDPGGYHWQLDCAGRYRNLGSA